MFDATRCETTTPRHHPGTAGNHMRVRPLPAVRAMSPHRGHYLRRRWEPTLKSPEMPPRRQKIWMQRTPRPKLPDETEKQAIIAACEAFIRDVLKPRFLPEIRPTEWNYVIDIRGAWAGRRYRFMQRYRSGMEDNRGEEFDAP